MGLKKYNCTIEEIGLTLPEAYAFIRKLNVNGEEGHAEFVIQASREKAINLSPLKTVHIYFKVNRDESPYVTAYKVAKSEQTIQLEYETKTVKMPFFGWQDDFVNA
jgi:hypothetical protein